MLPGDATHEYGQAATQASATSTGAKRKPVRTNKACERCKIRKQKCIALTPDGNAPCRNCHESMSACIFAPRAKRTKKPEPSTSISVPVQASANFVQGNAAYSAGNRSPSTNENSNPHTNGQGSASHSIAPSAWQDRFSAASDATQGSSSRLASGQTVSNVENSASRPEATLDFNSFWSTFQNPQSNAGTFGDNPPAAFEEGRSHSLWSPEEAARYASQQPSANSAILYNASQAAYEPQPPQASLAPASTLADCSHSVQSGTGAIHARTVRAVAAQAHSHTPQTSPTDTCTSTESDKSFDSTARGIAFVSLEAAAEGHYLGKSSGATWASLILGGIMASNSVSPSMPLRNEHSTRALPRRQVDLRLEQSTAAFVLETVYRHIQPRYAFMDWIVLHSHWQDRDKYITAAMQNKALEKEEGSVAFMLLATLAVGVQLCGRDRAQLPDPEEYYNLALQYMDAVVQLHNLTNIQALLLLAMYSLHDSKGPSVWYISGITVRLCIGMGLHRKASPLQARALSKYTLEMRKRVFWSSYTLDRLMSMSLGRPPGISDADIDVELPDDVDCVDLRTMPLLPGTTSSMSSSIHVVKLMQLLSEIQRTAYAARGPPATELSIRQLIQQIDVWQAGIPDAALSKDSWKTPCCSQDWFTVKSAEAKLYLLRPAIVEVDAERSPFLQTAAESAATVGLAWKRLHQQGQPMSSSALYTIFLSGLTLLYAVYLKPDLMPSKAVYQAARAFSNTLFSYSQNLKMAEPLYELFEDLSLQCLDRMNVRSSEEALDKIVVEENAPESWQQTLFGSANEINTATSGEFASLFESMGLPAGSNAKPSDFDPLPTAGLGTGLETGSFFLGFPWETPAAADGLPFNFE